MSTDNLDDLFFPYWREWQYLEMLSIRTTACLLTETDPAKHQNNRILPSSTTAMVIALEQAVILGMLKSHSLLAWDYEGNLERVDVSELENYSHISDDSMIKKTELAQWCEAKGIPHRWPLSSRAAKELENRTPIDQYPLELRAAIEVFEAVKNDPSATSRRSPKAAITTWLETNRPELSISARERVATVANWQPSGGAPKTPIQ